MPERLYDLLERPDRADSPAGGPAGFAESPED
jgi:hypothetical protein